MAIAAANCWFSSVAFTGCATTHRLFSTSHRLAYISSISKPSDDPNQISVRGKPKSSPCDLSIEKFPLKSRTENPFSNVDGRRGRSKPGQSYSEASKTNGNQGIVVNLNEQAEAGNLHNASFLNAVVKVYCTHTAPDYSLPWQKQRQYTSTGSAFMIGDGKLLTNAHCVEHNTQYLTCSNSLCYVLRYLRYATMGQKL